jgi:hypothetical protein
LGKIAMGFRRIRFVGNVKFFGEMKIRCKFLPEILKAVCRCRLKE